MIAGFRTVGTEDIFNGRNTQAARRTCSQSIWKTAQRKLELLDSADRLEDLWAPPGNRLERLTGDRSGQHSIRANNRYRICFAWTQSGPDEVEITDYH